MCGATTDFQARRKRVQEVGGEREVRDQEGRIPPRKDPDDEKGETRVGEANLTLCQILISIGAHKIVYEKIFLKVQYIHNAFPIVNNVGFLEIGRCLDLVFIFRHLSFHCGAGWKSERTDRTRFRTLLPSMG